MTHVNGDGVLLKGIGAYIYAFVSGDIQAGLERPHRNSTAYVGVAIA